MSSSTFLTAEWRKLAIANYSVDKQLLQPFLPPGTELDLWQNNCYVSLVGFMFLKTRLRGISVPCHAHFEEVNLRFYVRYQSAGIWKRGVVFIKEIVPRPALTLVARKVYKENYQTLPMQHQWVHNEETLQVEYRWQKKEWNSFKVVAQPVPNKITEGSEEEFITEHYWGYTKIDDGMVSEYEVQHPRWEMYKIKNYAINVDFKNVYGSEFGFLTGATPLSVMLAEGSAIAVKTGRRIVI
jgi:uncharacterized protein YqjF (DUF2071 family)